MGDYEELRDEMQYYENEHYNELHRIEAEEEIAPTLKADREKYVEPLGIENPEILTLKAENERLKFIVSLLEQKSEIYEAILAENEPPKGEPHDHN